MKFGICAMIKDEHLYLDEWLEYHLSLGVDHIYLFEDYGSKSHKSIIEKYNDKVSLMKVSDSGAVKNNPLRQCAVYEYFCNNFKEEIDWCAFIDIDEFIICETIEQLYNICSTIENTNFNGFVLWWKVYNANGHINRPEGSTIENYTQSIEIQDNYWGFKTVVNMKKDIKRWPICHTPWNVCDIQGNLVISSLEKALVNTNKSCYIAHYFTKSWEDWKKRLNRGNVAAKNRNIDLFFKLNLNMEKYKEELILEIDK